MIFVAILCAIFGAFGLCVAIFSNKRAKNILERVKYLDSLNKIGESRIKSLENEVDSLNSQNRALSDERASLRTALGYERKINAEKLEEFCALKEQSKNEFKVLSHDILEANLKIQKQNQKDDLDSILKPLQLQIDAFKRQISDIHSTELKERSDLMAEIRHLKDLNIRISTDAENLSKALKGNNKTLGNWGEMILEKLLQDSGLVNGRDYSLQQTHKNEDGDFLRPDVIVNLPNNKKIIIDSKVSLKSYESFITKSQNSADSGESLSELTAHIFSLKTHIKELSKKSYENLLEGSNLDFVLMFIPIEGAFLDAVRYDSELFSFAYNKNIILVSPTTLLATLRTIGNIWRNERQNSNVAEILSTASALYDKFYGFYESLEEVGKGIERANGAYLKSLNQLKDGKGSIYGKIQKLEDLGVKYKAKLSE